ncbi:hypothetical protein ACFH1L_01740 [Klebsiella michiganensis]
MNISTVNELIQSLESAGELSIKETKVMALAKAFKQLAAENVELKSSRAVLAENTLESCNSIACAGFRHEAIMRGLYASTGNGNKYPKPITTLVDEAMRKLETPATDRIVAGIKADGVEEFAAYCGEENSVFVEAKAYYRSLPDAAYEFCSMLREGAEK